MSYLITDADKKEFAEIEGAEAEINEMTTDIVALEAYRDGLTVMSNQRITLDKTARNLLNVGLANIKHTTISLEDAEGDTATEPGRMAKIGKAIKDLWLKLIAKIKATSEKVFKFIKSRLSRVDNLKRGAVKRLAEMNNSGITDDHVQAAWENIASGKEYVKAFEIYPPISDLSNHAKIVQHLRKNFKIFEEYRMLAYKAAGDITKLMDGGVEAAAENFNPDEFEKYSDQVTSIAIRSPDEAWHVITNRGFPTLQYSESGFPNYTSTKDITAKGGSVSALKSSLKESGGLAKMLFEESIGIVDRVVFGRMVSKIEKYVNNLSKASALSRDVNKFDEAARSVVFAISTSTKTYATFHSTAIGQATIAFRIYDEAAKLANAKTFDKEEGVKESTDTPKGTKETEVEKVRKVPKDPHRFTIDKAVVKDTGEDKDEYYF